MAYDLSIIIVNYNVRHFLEYCLLSVRKAIGAIRVQTIVIDNASTDDDYTWCKQFFPEVHFIRNNVNQGFGKANNQGLELATGEYILFLNPDTLIPENALQNCLLFFQEKTDCGALGVHMMDGKGSFLPESKRSLPTPMISFYKLSGLEKIFPSSSIFGQYALGYLNANEVHEVPVLAGAFMMVRRSLLQKVGGFDEAFFMYGEDIDLSFRLQNHTGFKNYFLGNVQILHFKGESSKQDTLHYNKIFNDAMCVFVKKYHSKANAFLMSASIRLGTFIRGLVLKRKGRQKAEESNTIAADFLLLGDIQSRTTLLQKLRTAQTSTNNSQNIVFCIGKTYSYENAFTDLSQQLSSTNIYWFEPEANTIIGSNKKGETGVVWKLINDQMDYRTIPDTQ